MSIALDTKIAKDLLVEVIEEAERVSPITADVLDSSVLEMIAAIFLSSTAAYRQALVGTCLVKLLSEEADLTLPSIEFGEFAYSGRTVDESVVMPVFAERRLPVSSSSAYLSTLRRGKRFVDDDVVGIRDRSSYLVVNSFVRWLQAASSVVARVALIALIQNFLVMREARRIDLIDLRRLSHRQLIGLVEGLLSTPSGGLLPMLIVVSALNALDEAFGYGWTIESQGINVADASSSSVGDITVKSGEIILFGIEVTERRVDADRVRTAMTQKAMPASVTNYHYFVTVSPSDSALEIAERYFGQGYDVGFFDISQWCSNTLGLTSQAREVFARHLRESIGREEVSASLKVAWNAVASRLV